MTKDKKSWFILQGNNQFGPFTEEELHELYKRDKIHENSYIWGQGLSKKALFKEIFIDREELYEEEIKFDFEKTVELPPLPSLDLKEEKKGPLLEKRKKRPLLLFSFLVILCVLLYFILSTFKSLQTFSRPSGMRDSDYQDALLKLKNFENAFYFSKDREFVFFISPKKEGEAFSFIFELIKNESFSSKDTKFRAQGILKDHLIKLKNFEFITGAKLVEGRYTVELKNKDLTTHQDVYLTLLSPQKFKKEVQKFWEKIRLNQANFWDDLVQQYETIGVIGTQIEDSLLELLETREELSSAILKFEKKYAANLGPFFTSFVIANEKNVESLKKKNFEDKNLVFAHYSKLSKLAKDIGQITMDILQKLKEDDLVSKNTKILDPLKELILEISQNKKEIEAKYL